MTLFPKQPCIFCTQAFELPFNPSYKIPLPNFQGSVKIHFLHIAFPAPFQTEGMPYSQLSFPSDLHFTLVTSWSQWSSISHCSFSVSSSSSSFAYSLKASVFRVLVETLPNIHSSIQQRAISKYHSEFKGCMSEQDSLGSPISKAYLYKHVSQ